MANEDSMMDIYPIVYIPVKSYYTNPVPSAFGQNDTSATAMSDRFRGGVP
jgi:hypothetical protein